jgi:outer membrane protein TolC
MTFDTLSYARRLRQAGVPEPQAEAMADATRELVMQDVASKSDIVGVKADIAGIKADLGALEQRLIASMETLSLRLTARMGLMLAAGLSLMTALIGLLVRLH